MKQLIGKTLLATVIGSLLMALPVQAQAQVKIGLIDLRKVFDGYYKTKQADASLKEEAADLEKQRQDMIGEFKKAQEDWKKLLDKSNDQAISAEEREKNKTTASAKLAELKDMEQTVGQFERSSRAKLSEKQRRKRDAILDEIRDVINAKAKAAGYTMVIDSAASSINDTPVVLFNNGENDITDAVLSQINAGAPPVTTPEEKPKAEEKK